MTRPVKYTEEMLQEAVRNCINFAEVMRYFGLEPNGGHHTHLSRRIRALGIDTSHFTGRPRTTERRPYVRHEWQDLLIEKQRGSRRTKPDQLRRALVEYGRPYRCSRCGTEPEWNGRPLTLHVDHIDGNPNDSRPENLRFLCPNCHSQTPTWAGRNVQLRMAPE
ncbi:HNH endonuclease [Rhodococcus pyridinivorans SB3094]|uniref:HNH endonuclease n=1 Tax=Rhodococcus pyridinivorans SB3094 TaxID=1435356 RepID=V9X9Z1_9NOCA|nr:MULTISPECIES: HNH endonuclease [Rhodococcus]AHD19228.1 HNH endonuclease [Rhodococcus pyridinivorans SB3094]MCT7290166.1 HNH endonuclease [Rhodococcus sp. PAE-6]